MKTAKAVTLGDLTAFFALLFSVFKRDQVWVVRFKTGQEPKLYPMARIAAQSLKGDYNSKAQEHIFVLDPQPTMRTWADEVQTHHISLDPHAVLEAALEQGRTDSPDQVEPETVTFDKRKLLTAVIVGDHSRKAITLEVWVGDTIIGRLVQGSNRASFTAFIGKVKVFSLAPLEIAVKGLLEACGFSLNEIHNMGGLIMPDGSIVEIRASPTSTTVEPTPAAEESKLKVANFGDLEPISKNHANILTGTGQIRIDTILADSSLQTRAEINEAIVAEYAEKLERDIEFDAIQVHQEGAIHRLTDGFHRLEAHKRVGREWIKADVLAGDHRAAFLAALQANQQHGLRRSSADKRHAIRLVLHDEELCNWSDRRIADYLDVDGKTVARERESLKTQGAVEPAPVRKSSSGSSVPAKRTQAEPSSAPVSSGPQSEPKASLEHGSTRGDQRHVFKIVHVTPHDCIPLEYHVFEPDTDIGDDPIVTVSYSQKKFWCRTNKTDADLTAKSWTGAVMEALGTLGIIDPNLEIKWFDDDAVRCDVPENPGADVHAKQTVKPAQTQPETDDQTGDITSRVEAHLKAALEALNALWATCSPRDIFDTLEAHHGLADLYKELYWATNRANVDMSDALEREGISVT